MAKQYMDYGVIGSGQLPLVEVQKVRHGQVYKLTHTGEGETSPYIDRAYISFTYGGRKIQDFGLIATTVNDRVQRQSPPSHEDRTTDYKMLHGQFYWGSRYNAREMNLTLATDGMTQRQLDDFKQWFRAGEIRQLIMAEHPNRGIMARVASSPLVSIVPFTRKEWITIDEQQEQITVGQYKGTIQLSFVMDDPFWYAINSLLGQVTYNNLGIGTLTPKWTNAKGETVNQLDQDALKIVYEDNIPTAGMIYHSVLLANDVKLDITEDKHLKWTLTNESGDWNQNDEVGTPIVNDNKDTISSKAGAIVGPIYNNLAEFWDEEIIELQEEWLIPNAILDNYGVLTTTNNKNQIALSRYIPVKAGSYISYTGNFFIDESVVDALFVFMYDKNTRQLKYPIKQLGLIGVMDNTNSTITRTSVNFNDQINTIINIQEDCYIRFYWVSNKINYSENGDYFVPPDLSINSLQQFNNNFVFYFHTFNMPVLSISKNEPAYLYYSGTAPSYPELYFTVPITFNNDGYIDSFNGKYVYSSNNNSYNSLCLKSEFEHELKITTPNIFTSYNKVISILKDNSNNNMAIPLVIQSLRNDITHHGVRNWIINCINIYMNTYKYDQQYNNGSNDQLLFGNLKEQLLKYMPYFFATSNQLSLQERGDPPIIQEGNEDVIITQQPFIEPVVYDPNNPRSVTLQVKAINAQNYVWLTSSSQGSSWSIVSDNNNVDPNKLTIIVNDQNLFSRQYKCQVSKNYGSGINTIDSDIVILERKDIQLDNFTIYLDESSSNDINYKDSVIIKNAINSSQREIIQRYQWQYQIQNSGSWFELTTLSNSDYIIDGDYNIIFTANYKNNFSFRLTIYNEIGEYVRSNIIDLTVHYIKLKDNYGFDERLPAGFNKTGSNSIASAGHTLTLSCQLLNTPEQLQNLLFQWQYISFVSGAEITEWTDISNKNEWTQEQKFTGINTSTLSFKALEQATYRRNYYKFRCKITGLGDMVYAPYSATIQNYGLLCVIAAQGSEPTIQPISNELKTIIKHVGDDQVTIDLEPYIQPNNFIFSWFCKSPNHAQWEEIASTTQLFSYTIGSSTDGHFTKDYHKNKYKIKFTDEQLTDNGLYISSDQITTYVYNPVTVLIQSREQTIYYDDDSYSNLNITATATQDEIDQTEIVAQWYVRINNRVIQLDNSSSSIDINTETNISSFTKTVISQLNCSSMNEYKDKSPQFFCRFIEKIKEHNITFSYDTDNCQVTYEEEKVIELISNTNDNISQIFKTKINLGQATYTLQHQLLIKRYQKSFLVQGTAQFSATNLRSYTTFYGYPPIAALEQSNDKMINVTQIQLYEIQLNNTQQYFLTLLDDINYGAYNTDNFQIALWYQITGEDIKNINSTYKSKTKISNKTTDSNERVLRIYAKFLYTGAIDLSPNTNNPRPINYLKNYKDSDTQLISESNPIIINLSLEQKGPPISNRKLISNMKKANSTSNINSFISQKVPYTINCNTGEEFLKIHYNTITWPQARLLNLNDPLEICYLSSLTEEDDKYYYQSCGDMILYNNLILNEQNKIDSTDNRIKQWSINNPKSSYIITYDGQHPLQNVRISYKNLYL